MLLDLSRFRTGTEHIDRQYEPAEFAGRNEDFQVTAPVRLVLDVKKDGHKVRLVGRVAGTMQIDCSRCLEAFTIPVDATFDTLFLPASQNTGEGERAVEEDDLGVSYYKDDEIDLGEVIREQFYLALPMKPLCRADCRGLCPICGVNRNRETCSCQTEWVDPRMQPLRKLRERQ
jgi:uncharacterized protein